MGKDNNQTVAIIPKNPGYMELGFAKIDTEREARTGLPEIIYGPGKSKQQLIELFAKFSLQDSPVIASRISNEQARVVLKEDVSIIYYEEARILARAPKKNKNKISGKVAVVTAGTSDIPIAEEACVTLELLGITIERFRDVGVAGLHRLMECLPKLRQADAIIVAAGMEGALPSVMGGLVKAPVIAVPTSVGYGASFEGLSALIGMMNSCAPGISVVNIDNGFGAAVCSYKWLLMANNIAAKSSGAFKEAIG